MTTQQPDGSQQSTPATDSLLRPASRLQAAVFYPGPVFIPQLTAALVSLAEVHLEVDNPGHGSAEVEGMTLHLVSVFDQVDTAGVRTDAERNGTWTDLVEPLLVAAVCHVVVDIDGITDPRAAQNLLTRVLTALTCIDLETGTDQPTAGQSDAGQSDAVQPSECVVHVPAQVLTTTGTLYRYARRRDGSEPFVCTWFNVLACWEGEVPADPQNPGGATSMAFTCGLHAMGMAEVRMVGVPWGPVETRDVLIRVVAELLRQGLAPQADIGFQLGPMPMVFVPVSGSDDGFPVLELMPRSLADQHEADPQG